MRPLILLGALLLAACGDMHPSAPLQTDAFHARFVAETHEDGVSQVSASFLLDDDFLSYDGVYLSGGDTLIFRTTQDRVELPGNAPAFEAELLSGILEDARFEFDLQRPGHASAPNSWGTLPAPMDLYWPESGQQYSLASDDLTLAWTDAGTLDDMWVKVEADCVEPNGPDDWWLDDSFSADIPGDPGLFSVDLEDKLIFQEHCARYAATVSLVRARAGEVDPAYAPKDNCDEDSSCEDLGYVSIRQVRSVEVVLNP